MEVTGRPEIVLGMTRSPEALGLLPVIVMVLPLITADKPPRDHKAVGRPAKDEPQPTMSEM